MAPFSQECDVPNLNPFRVELKRCEVPVMQDDIILPFFVQHQLKNFFLVSVQTKAFILQVTHPLGCSGNHEGACPCSCNLAPSSRVRLQKVSRGPPSPRWPQFKMRLSHHCVDVRRFSMWRITSSRFDTLCTKADSGNESNCADPERVGQECLDL